MSIKNFAIILMLLVATLFVAAYIPVDERDGGNPYPAPEATATIKHNPYPPPEATATPRPTKENDEDKPTDVVPTATQYRPTSAPTEAEPIVADKEICKEVKYGEDGIWYYCCKQFNIACHPGG